LKTPNSKPPQPNDGIDLVTTSGILLRVVAHINETLYTDSNSDQKQRQIEVLQHNDLSDPASAKDTTQG
jgi:hypothetical protein